MSLRFFFESPSAPGSYDIGQQGGVMPRDLWFSGTFNGALRDFTSVKDYVLVGDPDDGASFERAILDTPGAGNRVSINVPFDAYLLGSIVATQGKAVHFVADAGASFDNFTNLNGKLHRPQRITGDTFGTHDAGCLFAVMAHCGDAEAQVLGISNDNQLAITTDRDSVAFYAQNTCPAKFFETTGTTYTATTLVSTTGIDIRRLKVGMLIDTLHSPKYSARLQSWSADGKTFNVSGWYQQGNQAAGQVPPNGTHAVVNVITKVWALNANVEVQAASYGSSATGFELGVVNNKAAWAPGSREVWGFDAVNLGSFRCEAAFIARNDFYYGFTARGAFKACFHTGGSGLVADYGLFMELAHPYPIMYAPAGTQKFAMTQDGSLEIGNISAATTPYIDFRSSGLAADYDARIIASGGTSTNGQGTLTFTAASIALTGFVTAPTVAVDTNDARLATTAFYANQAGSEAPLADGAAAAGTSLMFSRQDHVHPSTINGTFTAAKFVATGGTGGTCFESTLANAGIELGSVSSANTPYLDFHSSGNNIDYDVRIASSGGTGTIGQGALTISCGSFELAGIATTTTAPAAGSAGALPATPAGYSTITINGTARKVAYY